jgi:Acetyltransferase (GNAT) domain
MTGYLHPCYAQSLSEFGEPLELRESRGWLLKRPIEGVADAMGTYPLFACADWKRLRDDLEQVGESIVSTVVVTDPFGDYDESLLADSFKDLMVPFKAHFVRDLNKPAESDISAHHSRNVRVGLKQVQIERCAEPAGHLDEWLRLYSVLTERHQIRGIRAFSRRSFELQLKTPGMVCFRAVRHGRTIGMALWYVQNDVAYYHLGAYTDEGYELRASFALFHEALEHLRDTGLAFASLGAGAGVETQADDGLSRFKRGWSNLSRNTFLCGRICNRKAYESLVNASGSRGSGYFPAYRTGEFN